MGSEFQPCQEVGDRQPEVGRTPTRQPSRFKLCASVLNLNDPPAHGLATKFKHNRLKINNYARPSTLSPSSSRFNTPQIGSSQVDLAPKTTKAPLDSSTLKRREGLGKMLSERLGLIGGEGEDGERRERMAEVVEKICLNNQEHLIDLVDRMENTYRGRQDAFETAQTRSVNAQLESFLESVSKAELDFLDMVYHNDAHLYGPLRSAASFARNLPPEHLVDIKKLIIEEKEFAGSPSLQYEKLKSKGLDLVRNGKVCFFLLAGGKCSRFLASRHKDTDSVPATYRESTPPDPTPPLPTPPLPTASKEFTPLNIPSERCILELILHRFIALSELVGTHLTLYLAISPEKIQELKLLFQRVALDPARLTVFPFAQKVVGAVDVQGRLVVEDGDLASLWSMGTGDMWNILSGDKELNFPDAAQLRNQGFEYLQVLGTSNALEKCFDCFALGVAAEQKLDWTTKVVESSEKSTSRSGKLLGAYSGDRGVESKIFLNESAEIYVCDPQEIENYPENCRYTFMNSSLFRIDYLCAALNAPAWQGFCARKKTHLTQSQPPFSRYRRVISYEKDYTDIFRLAATLPTRWKAILCDQRDYYPLVYHSHSHSDLEYASLALSELHKSYLGVGGLGRVEIDPHVSLEGEGLEQLRKEFTQEELTEEDWVFIQHNPYK